VLAQGFVVLRTSVLEGRATQLRVTAVQAKSIVHESNDTRDDKTKIPA
jgi:hypothetical protein